MFNRLSSDPPARDPSDLFPVTDPPGQDPDRGLTDLDPRFVFDFRPLDDPGDGQRLSTWRSVEPLCRGPEPRPDWLVTSQAAIDTELGVLKTGKEADVFLVERAVPGRRGVIMAAKRYRDEQHRNFRRADDYAAGRRVRNTRDTRAIAAKSRHGRALSAGLWAWAEWQALNRMWALGVPVPYPVQIDGTELLMEWLHVDGETAPRLIQCRPDADLLASYYDQLLAAMRVMVRAGYTHGDLSPYNVLAVGERLAIIDLPQVIDLAANPQGLDFLARDCATMGAWFARRGLPVSGEDLFTELLAEVW